MLTKVTEYGSIQVETEKRTLNWALLYCDRYRIGRVSQTAERSM